MADVARTSGGDRKIVIGREMTKRFEEFRSGTAADLAAELEGGVLKGEVTVVVAGATEAPVPLPDPGRALARALIRAGVERSRIARVVAEVFGLSRNDSYRIAMEATE